MKYAGMIKQSLVDYPGEIAAVLFTRGCNLRCPFCHNPDLLVKPKILVKPIDIEEVVEFLLARRSFLDGVVISGGEPTLNEDLPVDIARMKSLGCLIKLDTNGTNTTMLEKLLRNNMLDYVAMDIKAPLEYKKYLQACGKLSSEDFFNIRSSVHLLMSTPVNLEFRTTVVPALHTAEDIVAIARHVEGCDIYTLQQFNPRVTLEPGYARVVPYSKEEMQDIADKCAVYVKEVRVVNI
ncbi:MAG: anaerobic ribonucleoside-triphosphate reductase activating protein [Firmicutes bacterium HGW-Firmicutes-15]|nr:MAG: anaerobic ribonucleoside-triphosphate reductase activating protein [Firmicutes bacterium HGW-Firmicutes-15]